MPLEYNLVIALAELAYLGLIVLIMDRFVGLGRISKSSARKIVHLWLGGLIPFWFLFKPGYARFAFAMPIIVAMALLLLGIFVEWKGRTRILSFEMSGSVREVLFGPFMFMIMFLFLTFVAFKTFGGVAALCAMCFGDGIAPFIGAKAKYKYLKGNKSVEGSLGFFIVTLASIFVMFLVFFNGTDPLLLLAAVPAAIFGTIAEALTPGRFDNISVPMVVWLVFLVA